MSESDLSSASSEISPRSENVDKLLNSNKNLAAATLAAAIVTARGKPTSISEVVEIYKDLRFAMYPAPNYKVYKEWAETKDEKLAKVYD